MAHFYIMQTETNKERNQIKEVQEQTSLGVCMDLSCLTDNLSTTHTHISFHYIFEQDMKQQWGNAHLLLPHNNSVQRRQLVQDQVDLACSLCSCSAFLWDPEVSSGIKNGIASLHVCQCLILPSLCPWQRPRLKSEVGPRCQRLLHTALLRTA